MINLGLNQENFSDMLKGSLVLPVIAGTMMMPGIKASLSGLANRVGMSSMTSAAAQKELQAKARKMKLKEYESYKQQLDATSMGISLLEFKKLWDGARKKAGLEI
jgi:hypothetical protein